MLDMKQWIQELKIAIIEKDGDELIELSENIPTTDNIDLANEALLLIKEAVKFAQNEKIKINQEMTKLKKAKGYFS